MNDAERFSAIKDGPVEAALADYFDRLDRGENVELTGIIASHPGCETALRQFLNQERKLHEAVAAVSLAAGSTDGSAGGTHGDSEQTLDGNGRTTEIGPYRLLQQIGEGGMGSVWLAEQQKPVRRQVALKLIRPGHDTKRIIARFEAERQVLAMMDHPNIARVFDAGVSEDGRPYFAMELVQGVPFVAYCDQHRLTPQERLELFIPVCQAIQHAHQKGIIHRDIKPSNVLVTTYDGQPTPKVIDFGLAKALEPETRLTDKSVYTELGQVVGTIRYMSPEQAELNSLDVDTRSDIYSLGVLLYELLAGSTPLDKTTIAGRSTFQLLQLVREQTPPRPSDRLGSSDEAISGISAQRRTEPDKLRHLLRGDLDWIVMKAIEKDRRRRYETAAAFAEDVRRYLSNEPVIARPPSQLYRAKKFVQRNKASVAVAGVVLSALLLTLSGLVVSNRIIAAQRNETKAALKDRKVALHSAIEQEQLAKENFDLAEKAVDEYLSQVTDDVRLKQDDFHSLRTKLLETAIPFYEQFARQHPGDAKSQANRANAYARLASIHGETGNHDRSVSEYREAIRLQEELASTFPNVNEYRRKLADHEAALGWAFHVVSKYADAEPHYKAALTILQQLVDATPKEPAYRQSLAITRERYGLLLSQSDTSGARREYENAIVVATSLVAEYPDVADYQSMLASCSFRLGSLLVNVNGEPKVAQDSLIKASEIQRKLISEDPKSPDYRSALAESVARLGIVLNTSGDFVSARDHHEEAISIQEQVVAEFPSVVKYRIVLGGIRRWYAVTLERQHDKAGELRQMEEITLIYEKLAAQLTDVAKYARHAAFEHTRCAEIRYQLDDNAGSRQHLERALAILKKSVADFPYEHDYEGGVVHMLNVWGWRFATSTDDEWRDGKFAIDFATMACAITDYKTPRLLDTLAAAYAEAGDFDAAVIWSEKSLELSENDKGANREHFFRALASYRAKQPFRQSAGDRSEVRVNGD